MIINYNYQSPFSTLQKHLIKNSTRSSKTSDSSDYKWQKINSKLLIQYHYFAVIPQHFQQLGLIA
jgi:hypothetical protein